MTIKGLNPFLKKYCPEAFTEIVNSFFRGKRIAIDSDQVLRRLMSRAHKEIIDKTDVVIMEPDREDIINRWLYHVKNLVIKILKIGATPIFIFDGPPLKEKSTTKKKRREDKQKMIDRAEELKSKILEIDPLERTPTMVTELRKKMHHLGFLTTDEKEISMSILSALGIPVLRATGEGEQLCAMLCIEGKVDATWSSDTDLTAFGCPLNIIEQGGYIYNPSTNQMEESFKCVRFKPILSSLNLEYNTFLDLCIMAGCDFNKNIYNVGLNRSYPILKECKSIDNLPNKYHEKMECLNYKKCREILKNKPSHEVCQDKIILNIDTNLSDSRDILEMYGADDWLKDIVPLYKNLISPSNIVISKYPSLNSSKLKLNIENDDKEQTTDKTLDKSPDKTTTLIFNRIPQINHKKYSHLKPTTNVILNLI